MFGFLIGTACLIGLVRVLRRGACGGGWGRGQRFGAYGYGGGCPSRFGGGCGPSGYEGHHGYDEGDGFGPTNGGPFRTHGRRGGWRRGGAPFMANMMLRRLFEMLDTTPGQEKVIATAMEEMRAEAAKHRGEVGKTREELAKVMRGPGVDETLMGELFARHDVALEGIRKALVGALAKVHEALEPDQRARLADMIERTPGFWGGFGGRGVSM